MLSYDLNRILTRAYLSIFISYEISLEIRTDNNLNIEDNENQQIILHCLGCFEYLPTFRHLMSQQPFHCSL